MRWKSEEAKREFLRKQAANPSAAEKTRMCKCGCMAMMHFREILEVTERQIPNPGGAQITFTESKSRRGSCSRCVGCLKFEEVTE